jgi:hypothetical protein
MSSKVTFFHSASVALTAAAKMLSRRPLCESRCSCVGLRFDGAFSKAACRQVFSKIGRYDYPPLDLHTIPEPPREAIPRWSLENMYQARGDALLQFRLALEGHAESRVGMPFGPPLIALCRGLSTCSSIQRMTGTQTASRNPVICW